MKPTFFAAVPCLVALSSCAGNAAQRTTIGAGAGAAVGAVAGTALGADPLTGAAVGAIAGGAAGALVKGPVIHGRQYYRDTRGYCYYIDRNGNPRYAAKKRC